MVPPEAIAAMRAKLDGMEDDVVGVMEDEAVERQLRIADMEQVNLRNNNHDAFFQFRTKEICFY